MDAQDDEIGADVGRSPQNLDMRFAVTDPRFGRNAGVSRFVGQRGQPPHGARFDVPAVVGQGGRLLRWQLRENGRRRLLPRPLNDGQDRQRRARFPRQRAGELERAQRPLREVHGAEHTLERERRGRDRMRRHSEHRAARFA